MTATMATPAIPLGIGRTLEAEMETRRSTIEPRASATGIRPPRSRGGGVGTRPPSNSVSSNEFAPRLSRREREVLDLIVHGKTDRQIADELYISRITVSNHVVHILEKLEVPNRTAAAILAISHRGGGPPEDTDPTRRAA
jgi:DNA-binding NarL/FixJ family response regulator